MMKAMTATPPMVPTITAIMYFSENKGDQSTNIMAYNLIIKHIAHPTHRTTVHVANKKMPYEEKKSTGKRNTPSLNHSMDAST